MRKHTAVPFWRTIFSYAKPYRPLVLISVGSTMVTGFMAALQPLLIRYIIDEGISREGASGQEKMLFTALFAGIYLLAGGLRMGSWATGYRRAIAVIEGVLFRIRSRFFRHVQDLCLRFHNEVSSGELFNYIMGTPVSTLKQFLGQSLTLIPEHTVTLAVSVAMLSFFDWQMTLIMCVVAVTLAWINSRSRRSIKDLNADFMKTESVVSRFVADMLRGSRAIKLYAIEEVVSTRFDTRIHEIRAKSERNTFRQWMEYAKTEAFHYFAYAVIYLYGAYSCVYRGLSLGEFLAFVTSMHAIMGPFMTFLQLNLLRGSAEAGLERIEKILNTEKSTPELPPSERTTLDASIRTSIGGSIPAIEFRGVRFWYQPGRPVFEDLSCSIRRGESVALVGPSGSGKTTFANLLLRLYDPQSGIVAIYGNDIRHYALQELRSHFGVVPQDPFLFQATLRDNIRVARPDAREEDVLGAVEAAHLSELVRQLPDGLDTLIGESGFNLSGGQRQRVAIARAILGEPGFLLFDEATSALDNESEHHVQRAIEALMKSHTSIVIAHRLSTIRNVDRILVFDKGSIVQEGSYDSLSRSPGLFRSLLERTGFAPS